MAMRSRMSPLLTKSGSPEKGINADGRGRDDSVDQGSKLAGADAYLPEVREYGIILTWWKMDLLLMDVHFDGLVLAHLEPIVPGSKIVLIGRHLIIVFPKSSRLVMWSTTDRRYGQ